MTISQVEQAEATTAVTTPATGARIKPARRDKGGEASRRPSPTRKGAVKPKQGTQKGKGKAAAAGKRSGTKQEQLIGMLSRKEGATIAEIVKAFGWQPHTVRGALSGALKKKLGLKVGSEKEEGRGRVYRIAD
jgi:hypothetical protein